MLIKSFCAFIFIFFVLSIRKFNWNSIQFEYNHDSNTTKHRKVDFAEYGQKKNRKVTLFYTTKRAKIE